MCTSSYIRSFIFLQLQKICICLLFGCILQSIEVSSRICDDKVYKVNSTTNFVQVIEEIQDSSSQRNCYVLDFGQSSFEFDFNVTLNVTTNLTLHGMGAVITCNYPSAVFNFSAIIRITNVQYFGMSGIMFLDCSSSLYFENVTSVSINDSHFRYPLSTINDIIKDRFIMHSYNTTCTYSLKSVYILSSPYHEYS